MGQSIQIKRNDIINNKNVRLEKDGSFLSPLEVMLLLSMLVSVVLRVSALGYISILFATFITLLDVKRLLPFFFLASMATDLFVGAFGGGLPRIFELLLLIGMLIQNNGKVKLYDFPELTFICVATILSFILSETRTFLYLMSVILDVFVVFILINMHLSSNDLKILFLQTRKVFSMFAIFACVLMITNPYIVYRGSKIAFSLSSVVNPNTFSQMMVQIFMFFVGCICLKKTLAFNQIQNVEVWLTTSGAVVLLVLSGSRSGYFACMMGVVLAIAFGGYYKRSFGKVAFISLICLSACYLVIISTPALEDKLNILRIVESGGAGRMAMIEVELKYIIPNHLFFGVGIGTPSEVAALAPYFIYRTFSATNIIFSMFTQVGLIGFSAFWIYFIKNIVRVIKYRSLMPLILIPGLMFFAAICQGVGENIFYERYLWNAIALICVCYEIAKRGQNEIIGEKVN